MLFLWRDCDEFGVGCFFFERCILNLIFLPTPTLVEPRGINYLGLDSTINSLVPHSNQKQFSILTEKFLVSQIF